MATPAPEPLLRGETRAPRPTQLWRDLGVLRAAATTAPFPLLRPPARVCVIHDPAAYFAHRTHVSKQMLPPHSLVWAQVAASPNDPTPGPWLALQLDGAPNTIRAGRNSAQLVIVCRQAYVPMDNVPHTVPESGFALVWAIAYTAERRPVLQRLVCSELPQRHLVRLVVVVPGEADPSAAARGCALLSAQQQAGVGAALLTHTQQTQR